MRSLLPVLMVTVVTTVATLASSSPYQCSSTVKSNFCFEAETSYNTTMNVTSMSKCCALCEATPHFCRSWLYYPMDRPFNPGQCHLFTSDNPPVQNRTTCDIGIVTLPPGPPPTHSPDPPAVCDKPQPKAKPNIIHIVADDLGYNDLGYVNPLTISPYIDDLKKCGVELTRFHTFKMCGPSRGSMMTGRYPFHFGVYSNQDINSNGVPTNFTYIPELLRRQGYATHMIGKWHNGFRVPEMTPTYRGFDTFFGYYHCCSDYYRHVFADGNIDQTNATGTILTPDFGHQQEYSTFLYADEAARIIGNHPDDKPLYMYIPFEAVHGPLEVPESYENLYDHLIMDQSRKKFSGMMTALDDGVATIVNALKEKGLWSNTLLVFNSDNGGPLGSANNYPLRGGKFTLWEGGVRVTAFLSGPLVHAQRGSRWAGMSHSTDLYATFARLGGVSAVDLNNTGPVLPDGMDIWSAVTSGGDSPRNEVVHNVINKYNHLNCSTTHQQNCGAAIQVGKYKLMAGYPGNSVWQPLPNASAPTTARPSGPLSTIANKHLSDDNCNPLTGENCPCFKGYCLFDVEADPTEHHDIAAANPDIVRQLQQRLAEITETAGQSVAFCGAFAKEDSSALSAYLKQNHCYEPYGVPAPWLNDPNAPSCQ